MSPGHDKPARRARSTAVSTVASAKSPVSEAAKEFLDLFYPVHYKIGIGIEDALRGGRLSRHQVAILWLIRSAGEGGRTIPRKQIERSITRWFELRNSAISKTLRVMAREPLGLLEIREHPLSGREREVILTSKGAREIERMVDDGRRFIQTMVNHLSGTEASQGVHFLTQVSSVIDVVQPAVKVGAGVRRVKPKAAQR